MAVSGRSLACGRAAASPLDNTAATATRYLCSEMAVFTAAGGSNFVENLRRLRQRRFHGSGSPQLQRRGTVARARGFWDSTAPARFKVPRQQRGDFRAAAKLLTTWSRSSRLCQHLGEARQGSQIPHPGTPATVVAVKFQYATAAPVWVPSQRQQYVGKM